MQGSDWRNWQLPARDIRLYDSFIQRADAHLDEFIELFASVVGISTKAGSPEVLRTREMSRPLVEHAAPLIVEFIDGVVLGEPKQELNRYGEVLNFRRRFLGARQLPELQELRHHLEFLYLAGLFTHNHLTTYPTRTEISKVDVLSLQQKYMLSVLVADNQLRSYDRDQNNFPSTVAKLLFRRRVEPFLKGALGLGWWKRAKAESFCRNIYFAGILLGMLADMETSQA